MEFSREAVFSWAVQFQGMSKPLSWRHSCLAWALPELVGLSRFTPAYLNWPVLVAESRLMEEASSLSKRHSPGKQRLRQGAWHQVRGVCKGIELWRKRLQSFTSDEVLRPQGEVSHSQVIWGHPTAPLKSHTGSWEQLTAGVRCLPASRMFSLSLLAWCFEMHGLVRPHLRWKMVRNQSGSSHGLIQMIPAFVLHPRQLSSASRTTSSRVKLSVYTAM